MTRVRKRKRRVESCHACVYVLYSLLVHGQVVTPNRALLFWARASCGRIAFSFCLKVARLLFIHFTSASHLHVSPPTKHILCAGCPCSPERERKDNRPFLSRPWLEFFARAGGLCLSQSLYLVCSRRSNSHSPLETSDFTDWFRYFLSDLWKSSDPGFCLALSGYFLSPLRLFETVYGMSFRTFLLV